MHNKTGPGMELGGYMETRGFLLSTSYSVLQGRPWMAKTGAPEAIWMLSKLLIVSLRIRCVQAIHTDRMHVQAYKSPIIN